VRCVINNRVVLILVIIVMERTEIPGEGTGNPTLFSGVFEGHRIIRRICDVRGVTLVRGRPRRRLGYRWLWFFGSCSGSPRTCERAKVLDFSREQIRRRDE
jgi:hypothetical protein